MLYTVASFHDLEYLENISIEKLTSFIFRQSNSDSNNNCNEGLSIKNDIDPHTCSNDITYKNETPFFN
eukprot:UN09955